MATRFYFPATTAAPVSPGVDAGWNYAFEAARRKLADAKGSSAITVGTRIGPWTAGNYALDRQYVSEPLTAQTISGTLKMQLMTREYDANDNVGALLLCVKVVSNDGSSVRGTLLSLGNYGPLAEFINATSHRNKTGADGDALSAVAAQAGDRIVVEIGYTEGGYGATPEASAKWGENATDLPENETQTTDGAGWVEFSGTITMHNQSITGAGAIASAEAFGTPVIAHVQSIQPTAIASAEAFGSPTLTTGGVNIQPAGIASAEAFGSPTVAPGAVNIQPAGIASAQAFGTPVITGGAQQTSAPAAGTGKTRTVEVIRVGQTSLEIEYPGKLIVRLRDLSEIYEGGPLKGLAAAKAFSRKTLAVASVDIPPELAAAKGCPGVTKMRTYDMGWAGYVGPALVKSVQDLYDRMRGKRLSGINVDCWDQISGAYVGSRNTDKHGTLILPTDTDFVEVLQWKLNGGGYSDCFNGERGAGMPGLLFYFPCNDGGGAYATCFSGVSGQKAVWGGDWYEQGFFNRPALKITVAGQYLQASGAEPEGRRSFQFLWYCGNDPASANYPIFAFSGALIASGDFGLSVNNGKLQGNIPGFSQAGITTLAADTWYLIQINTTVFGRWNPNGGPGPPYTGAFEYLMQLDVYVGGALDLSIATAPAYVPGSSLTLNNQVFFAGATDDGLDEVRHLDRELYGAEIAGYAVFLKRGRMAAKSQGNLGSPGW